MRSWISICLWVLAILFPLAWLGTLSPASEKFIDWLLEPEWLHVVMHLIIYAGLVILILGKLRREGKVVSFPALIVIIIVIGITQELLQYITADYWISTSRALRGSGFDLMVDLAGGMLGLGVFENLLARKPGAYNPPME